MRGVVISFAAAILLAVLPGGGRAYGQDTWVGTWATAPSAMNNEGGALAEAMTLRQIVHVSRGGKQVRVTLTNELGTDSLVVEGAHLGMSGKAGALAGEEHALLFGGQPGMTIPPGAVAVSDPVTMDAPALSDLAITMTLPAQPLHVITGHPLGLQTNYEVSGGTALAQTTLDGAKTFSQWRFLKNVEVSDSAKRAGSVVLFGDSITDGYRSTPNTNQRWPDVLAARLQADSKLREVGVLNEGISGNRILHDGAGPNALARFDRDVLSQDGVRSLVILEAINDIGHAAKPRTPADTVTAEQLIVAYGQMIERAHAHGIKVYGATLTPFLGAGYASPIGETMRQTVNAWIRQPGHFDGVIDFDKVTRDPANPATFLPLYDSGDHLHPNDVGYKAMGNSVELALFGR